MAAAYSLKRKKTKHLVEGESIDYQPYYESTTSRETLLRIREAWEHKQDGCHPEECTSSVSHVSLDIKRGRFYERIRTEFLTIQAIYLTHPKIQLYFEGFGTYFYSADEEYVFNLDQRYQDDLEGLLQPPVRSYGDRISPLFPLGT